MVEKEKSGWSVLERLLLSAAVLAQEDGKAPNWFIVSRALRNHELTKDRLADIDYFSPEVFVRFVVARSTPHARHSAANPRAALFMYPPLACPHRAVLRNVRKCLRVPCAAVGAISLRKVRAPLCARDCGDVLMVSP